MNTSRPRSGRRFGLLVVLSLVAAACGGNPPSASPSAISSASPGATVSAASPTATAVPTTPSPSPSISRTDGWRADIDALLEARERLHPDPWHGLSRETWVAAADVVKAAIPTLTDDQALVELVRLAAMPGWTGREGHTGIFPFTPDSGTHEYPIRLWQFRDGLVITDARAPYDALIGARIEAIEGRPIEEVLALVEPLAPRDNPSNLLAYAPLYLRTSELLAGLGIIEQAGPATFSVVDRDGTPQDVKIAPIAAADDIAWHGGSLLRLPSRDAVWLRDMDRPLWWTVLAGTGTLYSQYNSVERGIDPIAAEILARAKEPGIEQVVVDLRHNGGGDNTTYRRLLAVLQDPAIDRPGRLTVLIGRLTFSAAANFATEVERTTHAQFAGEAMGGSPNLYGDVRPAPLPYSGQTAFIATRYWEMSTADDDRITIRPDLRIILTFEDYFAGLDPVLTGVIGGTPVGRADDGTGAG